MCQALFSMVRTQTKKIKKAMAQAFSDLLSGRIGRHMSKEINPPKKHGARQRQCRQDFCGGTEGLQPSLGGQGLRR